MSFSAEVKKVTRSLRDFFPATPCQKNEFLSKKYQANIYLKREDLTPVRSYKIRGAYNFIQSAKQESRGKKLNFVAASAGNHAQGFAFACQKFECPGTIFMPVTTPGQKVQKTRVFGGPYITIKLIGDTFDEAYAAAKSYGEKHQGVFVPPFDHPKIIEGQATIADELWDLEKSIDLLVVPVGGGGLSAGLTEYLRDLKATTRMILVEPQGAPALYNSLKKGANTTLQSINTFVDGAAVKRIGELNFEILKKAYCPEDMVLVPEARLCRTMITLLNHEGIILEPAGALSIDALWDIFKDSQWRGKNIVCIASGGNFDFERLPQVKEQSMKYEGTKKYLILRLPQRPGALKEFLNCLGPQDDIARFEYLKKSAKNFGSVLLGIETSQPENFESLFERLQEKAFRFEDVTDDEILADFVI
jgi:threonine dehydratase